MKIEFRLAWVRSGGPAAAKSFKQPESFSLFSEYMKRISPFSSCSARGIGEWPLEKKPGEKIWVCDRERTAKQGSVSSEDLALRFQKLLDGGTRSLSILIGGPDGFDAKNLEASAPDWVWSFGKMTLPHELASVVASEQIYRAWTLSKGHPYHSRH